jgi:DNA polymerase-3 subunit beta
MKISVARGDMLDSLSIVNRGLSSRSTLPILSSILLTARGDTLTMQSTDLEVSIRHQMPAKVHDEGSSVLPGRLLNDIVRSLPEAAVTIQAVSQDEAAISAEHASFSMKTLHPEDFPRFPEVDPGKVVSLETEMVAEAAKQVAKSASRDETRPVLTGVLVVVDTGIFRMVATDSYRLAVRQIELDEPMDEFEIVVPAKVVEEVPRLAADAERLSLGIAENQVVFTMGETTFVSRRIEGKFPNYKQLIPSEAETSVSIDKTEFLDAVKRVSLLAQQNAPLRVRVEPAEATVTLSANTQDVGGAIENLMVQAEGEDVEIAFNASLLAEGLAVAGAETVSLELTTPLKPGVLRSGADEDFTYIVMPVRIG